MHAIPRNVTIPVVCGVWITTLSVAGYIYVILPWFLDYYDYLQNQTDNSIDYGAAANSFHDFYWVGVPVVLAITGCGVQLLRNAERRADHLAWYAMLSMSLAAFWLIWTLLAERALYVLLLPA